MRPARQMVRYTVANATTGFPAILVRMLTRLGYRWYPEYYVFEEYAEFNQEQYLAVVHIWSREDRSIRELTHLSGYRCDCRDGSPGCCLLCSDTTPFTEPLLG